MLALLDDPNVADTEILYRRASWEKIGGRGKTEPGQIAKIHHNFFSDPNPRVAGRHAPADDDRCPPDLG